MHRNIRRRQQVFVYFSVTKQSKDSRGGRRANIEHILHSVHRRATKRVHTRVRHVYWCTRERDQRTTPELSNKLSSPLATSPVAVNIALSQNKYFTTVGIHASPLFLYRRTTYIHRTQFRSFVFFENFLGCGATVVSRFLFVFKVRRILRTRKHVSFLYAIFFLGFDWQFEASCN